MPLTLDNIAFQALSLAVLGAWCWMLYEFRAQAARCLKSTVVFVHAVPTRSDAAAMYDGFLGVAITLGALSAGLGVAKITAVLLAEGTGTPGTVAWQLADLAGTNGLMGIPSWVAPAVAVAVAVVWICVAFFETSVLRIAGAVALAKKFTGVIIQTKKNWFAAVSILAVPLVTVWTGVNPVRDQVVAYLFTGMAVASTVLFAVDTLRAFLKQKVSLLVWFLYLCTVEVFPVCAVVLAVIKNM